MGSTLRHDVKTSKQNIVEVDIAISVSAGSATSLLYGEDVTVADASGIVTLTWGSPMGKLLSASGSVLVATAADACVQFKAYSQANKTLSFRTISNTELTTLTASTTLYIHCVFDQND